MAQFRLSVSVAKRSTGRSATAMAAYRAGAVLHDERTGETFDYTRKGGVLHSEIIVPQDAPDWARDRQQLWNHSEAANRRGDAIVAREIQLSLPHELTDAQRQELTGEFAHFLCGRYQVAVDTNIHAPNPQGDERNYHAHLLICTRGFDPSKAQGLGNNIREFDAVACQRDGKENPVELWRATWAQQSNAALERAEVRDTTGESVSLDHRSYERQGVEQEPTIKEGAAVTGQRRRGEAPDRAEKNDAIRARNQENEQMRDEIETMGGELDLLRRRQAGQLTADQVQRVLTPVNDNVCDTTEEELERQKLEEAMRRIRDYVPPQQGYSLER